MPKTFKNFKASLRAAYNTNFKDYNRTKQTKQNMFIFVLVQIITHYVKASFGFEFGFCN